MTRFDLVDVERGYDLWREMEVCEDGEWVRYEDVLAMIEEMRKSFT